MLTNLLTITLYFSLAAVAVLLTAKLVIFSRQRLQHEYHIMCLLYFPGIDIMFTSDSRQKRDKQLQNRLTKYAFFLLVYVFAVVKLWPHTLLF